jgi:hypothetical protein
VAWLARRAQIAESHRRRSRLSDPDLVQARHSPTVEIAVDDPEAKRKARRNITRVRQSEAWRHNNLDAMQRQAETEMLTAWSARTMGLSAQGLRLDRLGVSVGAGGSVALFDHFAHLEQTWVEWAAEAKAKRISRSVVIEILAEPRTLVEVERDHHMPRGRAIEVYRDALDLWAKLRGWVRPSSRTGGRDDR